MGSLDVNDGVSEADEEAVEAARKAGCEVGASQPKSSVAEGVPPECSA